MERKKNIFFGKKILWGELVGKSTAPGLVNRDDRLSFISSPNFYRLSMESFKTEICSPFVNGCGLIFNKY